MLARASWPWRVANSAWRMMSTPFRRVGTYLQLQQRRMVTDVHVMLVSSDRLHCHPHLSYVQKAWSKASW